MLKEGCYMANYNDKEYSMKTDKTFQRGQNILYRGEEAKILDVKPVLTIKIESKHQIMCGDVLLKDICLKEKLQRR
jgi:hypothetical protein